VPQRRKKGCGIGRCLSGIEFPQGSRFAAKIFCFVIPSEARNLSSIEIEKREIPRFARNDKTKSFSEACSALAS
jgi:hypothetical protein